MQAEVAAAHSVAANLSAMAETISVMAEAISAMVAEE